MTTVCQDVFGEEIFFGRGYLKSRKLFFITESVERCANSTDSGYLAQAPPSPPSKPDGSGKPTARPFTGRGLATHSRTALPEEPLHVRFQVHNDINGRCMDPYSQTVNRDRLSSSSLRFKRKCEWWVDVLQLL
jgi:hypothetical protein